MSNTPSKQPVPPAGGGPGIQLRGGAAILAPVSSFPNGVPGNALVLLPIQPNGTPLEKKIVDGPVALMMEEVWKLLGFNGPAVQVQDEQGRPIAIGLDDLLSGLEKHWTEGEEDLNRGRIFAQELIKYGRHEKAEKVLSKVVALGGDGEDWLGLGVAQLAQKKLDKAEATLRGAQNLLKDSPFPSLQLAKVMKEKGDRKAERENTERAIQIDNNSVDAWAYLAGSIKETSTTDEMVKQIEELAKSHSLKLRTEEAQSDAQLAAMQKEHSAASIENYADTMARMHTIVKAGVQLIASDLKDVIDPATTRWTVALALRKLQNKREVRPPKKHGNIPL